MPIMFITFSSKIALYITTKEIVTVLSVMDHLIVIANYMIQNEKISVGTDQIVQLIGSFRTLMSQRSGSE